MSENSSNVREDTATEKNHKLIIKIINETVDTIRFLECDKVLDCQIACAAILICFDKNYK